mmetsp:Transcript_13629/g.31965  ORF Transcript_13629/g.31965 Transcript_13629/m.31965 type:complete len:86 (+) Transcript_13629:4185-4442(+)
MWLNKNSQAWRYQSGDSNLLKSSLLNSAKARRVGQNAVKVELNISDMTSELNKHCLKKRKQSLVSTSVDIGVKKAKSDMYGGKRG